MLKNSFKHIGLKVEKLILETSEQNEQDITQYVLFYSDINKKKSKGIKIEYKSSPEVISNKLFIKKSCWFFDCQ